VVVLGLLAGVTAGLATSALSGARRTDTAFDRLHEETRGAHAIVFATYDDVYDADWGPILADPAVEAGGTFALAPVALDVPGLDEMAFVLPPSGGLYVDTEAPVITSGRRADPDRADEMWIDETVAADTGLEVGDTLDLVSYRDLQAFFGDVESARPGPSFPVTITGIGKVPTQFTWMTDGQAYVSRAVLADNPEIPAATNLVVRLRDGAAGLPRLRELVAEHITPNTPILDLVDAGRRVKTSTDVERNGLLLFGLAVGAAGLLVVGQAIVRSVQASAVDAPTLRDLGLVRPELTLALLLPVAPAALLAGGVTVTVATLLSARYPIGLARQIEPHPGAAVELGLVLGLAALTVLVVFGIGAGAARGAVHRLDHPLPTGRRSVVEQALTRLSLPLPVAVGTRFALSRGRGRSALPAGPAVVGAVGAVLGVVAAFTLAAGIEDAIDDPSLVGSSWDATTFAAGEITTPTPEQRALVADSPAVAAHAVAYQSISTIGGEPTPLFGLEPVAGNWSYRLLDGRPPAGVDEIVLGPDTLDELGLEMGDEVMLGPDDGLPAQVVGTALLQQGVHWAYDQGGWLTPEGLDRVAATTGSSRYESLLLRWAPGTDVRATTATFTEAGLVVEDPELPQTLRNLGFVRTLPFLLAGFLLLLGIGAVGHSLISAVRVRRHELAVLRTLGMTPRQAWASSAWQATSLGVVGVLLGVPLGVAIGRTAWRWIADAAPIYYVPPTALLAVLLAAPVAVLLANALAALPGRAAARIQPAQALRTE